MKIEYKSASVYDELPEGQEKPALGKGLNRPAVVTLCGLFPKYENPTDEQNRRYEEKVRKNTGRMGEFYFSRGRRAAVMGGRASCPLYARRDVGVNHGEMIVWYYIGSLGPRTRWPALLFININRILWEAPPPPPPVGRKC